MDLKSKTRTCYESVEKKENGSEQCAKSHQRPKKDITEEKIAAF